MKKFMKGHYVFVKWGSWICAIASGTLLLISLFTGNLNTVQQFNLVMLFAGFGICVVFCFTRDRYLKLLKSYETNRVLHREIIDRQKDIIKKQEKIIEIQKEIIHIYEPCSEEAV